MGSEAGGTRDLRLGELLPELGNQPNWAGAADGGALGIPAFKKLNKNPSRQSLVRERSVLQAQRQHFANYNVWNIPDDGAMTRIYNDNGEFDIKFDNAVFYLPNDFCEESYSIHQKVIFNTKNKLDVQRDYVTCHNILLKKEDSILSKTKSAKHIYPILHTNKQIWYSSKRQDFADNKKIMWSRSGYTKPFYDPGNLGTTDMGYYINVDTDKEGETLNHNLNLKLFKYIFTTAKWSGFGNEKVFASLPTIPLDKKLSDEDLYDYFGLKNEERDYVRTN